MKQVIQEIKRELAQSKENEGVLEEKIANLEAQLAYMAQPNSDNSHRIAALEEQVLKTLTLSHSHILFQAPSL